MAVAGAPDHRCARLPGARAGDDPDRLLRAVEEIEFRLSAAPLEEGESRSDPERVLIVHPLSVRYEAFEAEQVVIIYAGVYYPRQRL